MKSFDEYETVARDGSPFSNGTDWEIWQFNVCLGTGNDSRRCVNDDNDDCPLVALALVGRTPAEWTGPHGRYLCSEKTTPAQARAAAAEARRQADAEVQQQIADSHYPLFNPDQLR